MWWVRAGTVRGVGHVAELAVGVYHVERTKAREADAIVSRSSVSVSRTRLRIKSYKYKHANLLKI